MSDTERCSHCDTRIHPLDVSELHRGHTLKCHHCGAELKAQARTSATVAAALIISIAVMLSYWIFPESALLGSFGIAFLLLLIDKMTPPGLIAGAPWVQIKATNPEAEAKADEARWAQARERIKAMRRENRGKASGETER